MNDGFFDDAGAWVRETFGDLNGHLIVRDGQVVGFQVGAGMPVISWPMIAIAVLLVVVLLKKG